MQLEDYFDFLSEDDIRIKGTRIGIESVLYEYIHRDQEPKAIVQRYHTLSLEQVYATILYYLHNREKVGAYLADYLEYCRKSKEEYEENLPPVVVRLRQLKAERKSGGTRVEMKPSGVEWIGEIPKHWEVKRLKYVADLNMGQSPPSEEYNSDQLGTPFLQGNAEFGLHHPTPKVYCPTAKKQASPGDILLSVRAPVGAINVADQEYGIGRGLCAIRPRINQLERRYIKYLLEVVRNELYVVATGTTYDAVTVDEVSHMTCVVPPLSEQHQIANFLNSKTGQIDKLIAAEQRKIELLKEYRQSLISEVVTGKIDVRNEV